MEYVMLSYESYDTVEPELLRYTGDEDGAIAYAKSVCEFEVDVYEGTRIHPDARSVCAVMYDNTVMMG